MSPIAIGLDGLLILLLLITLMVGLRLDRRLKGLRADHAGFAKAVSELDQALARAEGGLKELRSATAEAQSVLTTRVQEARAAAARLDEMIAKAALAPSPQISAHPREGGDPGFLPLDRIVQAQTVNAQQKTPGSPPSRGGAGNNVEPFRPSARSRARVDEDLFEVGGAEAEALPRLRFGGAAR